MNQDDIYNLLLLMLLLSNEKENCDNNSQSTRGSLNELMLASMLFGSCNGRDGTQTLGTCPGRNRNTNTTF